MVSSKDAVMINNHHIRDLNHQRMIIDGNQPSPVRHIHLTNNNSKISKKKNNDNNSVC